jgi:hypothetical protein
MAASDGGRRLTGLPESALASPRNFIEPGDSSQRSPETRTLVEPDNDFVVEMKYYGCASSSGWKIRAVVWGDFDRSPRTRLNLVAKTNSDENSAWITKRHMHVVWDHAVGSSRERKNALVRSGGLERR